MSTSLREIINSAKGAIADLSSLEIQTYTGEINVAIESIGTTNLEKILKEKADAKGNIKLVQVTKINIDGDAINLVPDTELPKHVAEAHQAALIAGENARTSILTLFKELIEVD